MMCTYHVDLVYPGAYDNFSPKEIRKNRDLNLPLALSKILVQKMEEFCDREKIFYPKDDILGADNFIKVFFKVQNNSQFTIVILNTFFFKSGWNLFLAQSAFRKKIQDASNRVFFVVLDNVKKKDIVEHLDGLTEMTSINYIYMVPTEGSQPSFDNIEIEKMMNSLQLKLKKCGVHVKTPPRILSVPNASDIPESVGVTPVPENDTHDSAKCNFSEHKETSVEDDDELDNPGSTVAVAKEYTTSAAEEYTASAAKESTASAAEESTAFAAKESASAAEEYTASAAKESTASAVRESTAFAAKESASAAEESTASAAEESTASAARESTASAAGKSTAFAAKKSTASAAGESTAFAAKKSTASAAKESTAFAAKKSTASAAEESTAFAAKESTASAAEESTAFAAKKSTASAAEESTAFAAKKSTASAAEESDAPTEVESTSKEYYVLKCAPPLGDAPPAPPCEGVIRQRPLLPDASQKDEDTQVSINTPIRKDELGFLMNVSVYCGWRLAFMVIIGLAVIIGITVMVAKKSYAV